MTETIAHTELATESVTRRPISEGIEKQIDVYHQILDKGFIAVKDYLGNDLSILQMARVSYGKGTKGTSDDRALLRYMMRNLHSSPFEGCVIKLYVKLPIFVMRQWVRHRTASLNEYSGRYSVMKDEFFIPEPDTIATQSTMNKQGRSEVITPEQAELVRDHLRCDAEDAFAHYHCLLGEEICDEYTQLGESFNSLRVLDLDPHFPGISREMARINLPLSTYTEMYWQINLHNLFHFLGLRADSHAQYEIRVYAEKILEIVKDWVPLAYEAFIDYKHQAVTLSRMEVELIQEGIAHGWDTEYLVVRARDLGMTKREITEFCQRFGLPA